MRSGIVGSMLVLVACGGGGGGDGDGAEVCPAVFASVRAGDWIVSIRFETLDLVDCGIEDGDGFPVSVEQSAGVVTFRDENDATFDAEFCGDVLAMPDYTHADGATSLTFTDWSLRAVTDIELRGTAMLRVENGAEICTSLVEIEAFPDWGPQISNRNALVPDVTIDTFATAEGTLIHGTGIEAGPFSTCGRIASLRGYRTETELVLRVEDELGFCWDTDAYFLVLLGVSWRDVEDTNLQFAVTRSQAGSLFAAVTYNDGMLGLGEPDFPATVWMDDPSDRHFYLSIPLEKFSFATDSMDGNSAFDVGLGLVRGDPDILQPMTIETRDRTAPVIVDFVDVTR